MEPATRVDPHRADIPLSLPSPLPLPLRGQAAEDGPLLRQLHRHLLPRLPALRLHGFAAPASQAASDRLHLLGGLLSLPLMSVWPAAGLSLAVLLTLSMLLHAVDAGISLRTGRRWRASRLRGLRLAPGQPGWSLLLLPSADTRAHQTRAGTPPAARPRRLLFGSLDAPPSAARHRALAAARLAALLALLLCCLLPGSPGLFWPVVSSLCAAAAALWLLDLPPRPVDDPRAPQARTLATLLALCRRTPPDTWILAAGHSHAAVEAVLDWWGLDGRGADPAIALVQLDPGDAPPFPGALRFPLSDDPERDARRLLDTLGSLTHDPA